MQRAFATAFSSFLVVGLVATGVSAQSPFESANPPTALPEVNETTLLSMTPSPALGASQAPVTSNQMLWQQYQALNVPTSANTCQECGACNGGSGQGYNRCGCNTEVFPWIKGPGSCDQWCVGPRWETEFSGLIFFHENADWNSVIANVGGAAPTLVDQFNLGPGARVSATAYNESGFGMQVAYEGINDWNARSEFPLTNAVRTFNLDSTYNSVEINFLPAVPYAWKFFGGFRYVEIDEGLDEFTVNDKTIPLPANPPAAPVAVADSGISYLLENRLIGFQLGSRRDTWHWGKQLSFESFFNGGVYVNKFKREDVARTITTITTGDDISTTENEFSQTVSEARTVTRRDYSEAAFMGEAGITGIYRLNQCVALRGGYQVMVVDGVGEAIDAFLVAGDLQRRTQLYHGLQFGIEYRR